MRYYHNTIIYHNILQYPTIIIIYHILSYIMYIYYDTSICIYTIPVYIIYVYNMYHISISGIIPPQHPQPWAVPTLVEGLQQPPVLGLCPGQREDFD